MTLKVQKVLHQVAMRSIPMNIAAIVHRNPSRTPERFSGGEISVAILEKRQRLPSNS
jgi:hypothetical protein